MDFAAVLSHSNANMAPRGHVPHEQACFPSTREQHRAKTAMKPGACALHPASDQYAIGRTSSSAQENATSCSQQLLLLGSFGPESHNQFQDVVGAMPVNEWLLLLAHPSSGIFLQVLTK